MTRPQAGMSGHHEAERPRGLCADLRRRRLDPPRAASAWVLATQAGLRHAMSNASAPDCRVPAAWAGHTRGARHQLDTVRPIRRCPVPAVPTGGARRGRDETPCVSPRPAHDGVVAAVVAVAVAVTDARARGPPASWAASLVGTCAAPRPSRPFRASMEIRPDAPALRGRGAAASPTAASDDPACAERVRRHRRGPVIASLIKTRGRSGTARGPAHVRDRSLATRWAIGVTASSNALDTGDGAPGYHR
ncbi:hypothetical protein CAUPRSCDRAFT_12123 [Caulochytrium protostelioides]|uniref:Uncharacterized protein n=1 Tax=Caulochytrium protostelioides TaxID=1555241 RepID=A0A4P9WSP4_9FUNG|nr:hypothetical protein CAUPRSCDRAFT_12123 [Caulochytrium protostelioides]